MDAGGVPYICYKLCCVSGSKEIYEEPPPSLLELDSYIPYHISHMETGGEAIMDALDGVDYKLLEDEGCVYCPEIDPSLDRRVITDRKTLLDAAFGKNKRKQRKALIVLDAAYGMTSIFRKGHGAINIQEALNGKEK